MGDHEFCLFDTIFTFMHHTSGLFHLRKPPRIRKPPLVCPRSKTRGGFLKCQLPPTGEIWLYLVQKPVGKCISAIEIVVCGNQISIFFACGSQNASEPIKFDDFRLIQNWHLRKPPLVCPRSKTRGGGFLKWNTPDGNFKTFGRL